MHKRIDYERNWCQNLRIIGARPAEAAADAAAPAAAAAAADTPPDAAAAADAVLPMVVAVSAAPLAAAAADAALDEPAGSAPQCHHQVYGIHRFTLDKQ